MKDDDYIGHARYNDIEVSLSSQKGNTPLKNHYMITSFEVDEKVLRELETIAPLSNDYRDGGSISNLNENNITKNPLTSQEVLLKTTEKPTHFPTSQAITKEKAFNSLNSAEPNLTTNPLKTQDLSPLELAKAEKLAKLESEQLESEKEFLASHQIFLKEAKDNAIN
ncbi:DUF3519 domain-containing protein [Helicobacter pylori]|nr:DUF3519 domain-containing protein [Helicobacter pylori]